MADIKPFKAARPVKDKAAQVASKPYDVLSSAEARKEAEGNADSFYHISKAEIDLSETADVHSPEVYQKAAANLKQFIDRGVLVVDDNPCYYIYELVMNGKSQTGLVALSSVKDYNNDIIKKHEFTRPEKEQDRINHIKTTRAQTGNVFLAYNGVPELNTIIRNWKKQHEPIYDFTTADKVKHTVWAINNESTIAEISDLFDNQVRHTYIADGHHRAASAALVAKALEEENGNAGDAAYFLTTLFPAEELTIMDYNRVVKDLNGLTEKEFLSKLQYDFQVVNTDGTPVKPSMLHEFGMYLNGEWYRLVAEAGAYDNDPIGILDVTILQKNVLDKLLGIKDPRTDSRIDFVGGIRGLEELEKRVDSGEMKVAFALHAVTIEQLFEIADTGNVMPPKSTWFEPKLRDGLFTNLI